MSRVTFVQWNKQGVQGDRQIKIRAVGSGMVSALSSTLAVFLMLSFVVAITNLPVYNFAMAIMLTMLVSSFLGGKGAGTSSGIRGWQHGAVIGLIYGLLFVLLSAVSGIPIFDPFLMTGSMVIAGVFGGIMGVNLPAAKRQGVTRRAVR